MAEKGQLRRFPLTVQTAYSDLLARLQEDAVLELGGTPVLRERRGRKYWYTVQRLADHTVERYLGPDIDEVRARVERAREVKEDLKLREQQRGKFARMCREGGLLRVDAQTGKVLFALSKAGIFRLRSVVVGTHAFRCYPGILGVEIPEALAATEDIDVAAFHSISVALDDRLDPTLADALQRIGPFVARPSIHIQPTAWRDHEGGALVELLTPNEGPDRDEPLELPALGAYAQPLRFLDYLIHQPVQAAVLYRSGVLVNVPQPARYAIHKLIVAVRRASTAAAKAAKDIEQSAALIRILAEDRPDELEEAFLEAQDRGRSWRDHINRGMRRLPEDAQRALVNAIERFEHHQISAIPNTIEDLVEEMKDPHGEADVEAWAKVLGVKGECAICSATVIEPNGFAEAAVQHYGIPQKDADAAQMRIENALRTSGAETGGWGDGTLCAYHNEQATKDD
jgi:hypothetical protein